MNQCGLHGRSTALFCMVALSIASDAALKAKAQAMLQLRLHIGMHVAVSARAVVGCKESDCFTVGSTARVQTCAFSGW